MTLAMDLESLTALEWVVVGLSVAVALWVIVKAVRLTMHPGETEPDHVKRVIFQEEDRRGGPPGGGPPADGPRP